LVYDVVGYSDLHHDQLPKVVEDLRRQVDAACRAHGMDPRDVIPTGDGGVLVGETGPQTWRFATSLFQRCKRAGIKIRIGVALGPIVLLKDPSSGGDVPVGAGILEADRLSELAVVDAICVHREIWETYLMKSDRQEWASQNLEDEQKALLVKQLRPSGDGTAPAPDTNQASSVKPASTPRLPKIPPGSFESDREALDFADSLFLELKRRCGELEENGLQATLEGGGANSYYRLDLSYRHVHVYSFYMNVTWGIEGNPPPDISLSAYPGPCTGSAPEFKNLERGWCNASGPFLWDTEKNMPAWEIDLTNDLLREGSYSYEDLLEALWHLICEALELSVKLCGRF
jgi:hypothetical protein